MPPRLRLQQKPLSRPKIICITCGKGGVGKTTTTVSLYDLFDLHQQKMIVVQLDKQDRLARTIGQDVINIPTDILLASRSDPSAGVKAFRLLVEAIDRAATSDEIILLDVGASFFEYLLAFARLANLDEDFRTFPWPGLVLVPSLAEPESLHQAAITIQAFREVLPSLQCVFVENQRDGTIADLVPGSEARRIYEEELAPILPTRRLVLPAVAGRSWALFERHFCRPLQVVGMDVREVMALTGLPRAEARIARGDVAAWVAEIEQDFSRVLGLRGGE